VANRSIIIKHIYSPQHDKSVDTKTPSRHLKLFVLKFSIFEVFYYPLPVSSLTWLDSADPKKLWDVVIKNARSNNNDGHHPLLADPYAVNDFFAMYCMIAITKDCHASK
jgi:hypothetical protein